MAIGYAAPLIVVVLAALVLKETVRAYRWSAVAIGFVGVILMLTPQFGVVDAAIANENRALGATFAIFAALCNRRRDDPGPPPHRDRAYRRHPSSTFRSSRP